MSPYTKAWLIWGGVTVGSFTMIEGTALGSKEGRPQRDRPRPVSLQSTKKTVRAVAHEPTPD